MRRSLVVLIVAGLAAMITASVQPRDVRAAEACTRQIFEGDPFLVCAFDARRHELRLASRAASGEFLRSFPRLREHLGADAARARFAMNAGMYDGDGAPIGLFVEDGVMLHPLRLTDGPGNFHLKPNGVFSQDGDGALHIETSEAYAARAAAPRWASQSGPMLVIDGALHPAFAADGASHYVRNGVGLHDRYTAYFVISERAVSFGRFARFFRDALGCSQALFFDGGVSSAWVPRLNRLDRAHPLGPMVVALDQHASPP